MGYYELMIHILPNYKSNIRVMYLILKQRANLNLHDICILSYHLYTYILKVG